ncbi:MAG: Asp-tRNA(Asn)/Glu-tRNA(Gln) amidotransferase subunit GatC [Chloroflexota bacterium]|nr:Asp-tRNA(Asn)/Glu-tRNA(Gln) amidotransferase subunit GatC [Chloroflexota bacterium]
MSLEHAQVEQIALLARISLTPEEVELFQGQLSQLLEQFQVLSELDTTDVPPAGHAVDLQAVMRDDDDEDSLDPEDVLRNAPNPEGEYFRVKAVLEE